MIKKEEEDEVAAGMTMGEKTSIIKKEEEEEVAGMAMGKIM